LFQGEEKGEEGKYKPSSHNGWQGSSPTIGKWVGPQEDGQGGFGDVQGHRKRSKTLEIVIVGKAGERALQIGNRTGSAGPHLGRILFWGLGGVRGV